MLVSSIITSTLCHGLVVYIVHMRVHVSVQIYQTMWWHVADEAPANPWIPKPAIPRHFHFGDDSLQANRLWSQHLTLCPSCHPPLVLRPALVALVAGLNPAPQVAAYCAAMLAGMAVDCAVCDTLVCTPRRRKTKTT